jgi:putative salt-induced outer membrane protein YdiY
MRRAFLSIPAAFCAGVLLCHAPAQAQTGPAPEWSPTQLKEIQHDWIQLKSGEWLKGRFRGMQGERLSFYSEELDGQEFDWDKIIQLHTLKPVDLLLLDRTTVSGRVRVNSQYLVINEDAVVPQLFERDAVVAISPGGRTEWDRWSVDLAFGMSVRSGNVDQTDVNSALTLKRVTASTRLGLTYSGYQSVVSDRNVADNHRGTLYFDQWLSDRLYWRIAQGELYRDPFQNIAARITAGTGLGYDIFKGKRFDWHVTAGPAAQWVRFSSVAAGQDSDLIGPAGIIGTQIEWEVTRRIDFNIEYTALIADSNLGGIYRHFEARWEVDLTSLLDLDISFIWDRVTDPIPDVNGVTPKPDDFRLVTSLSLEF